MDPVSGRVCRRATGGAQAFEPGRRYDEATVNGVLKTVTDDHAALRRYLVDEGTPFPYA
jgi:Uncharacterized protein conserved in bacteria (DUF2087)